MKRVSSTSSSYGDSKKRRITSIKNKFLSVFGLATVPDKVENTIKTTITNNNNNNNNNNHDYYAKKSSADIKNDFELKNNGYSTPADLSMNSSFQRNDQGPVTAKQLQEYYNSLLKESSQLTEQINNSNTKMNDGTSELANVCPQKDTSKEPEQQQQTEVDKSEQPNSRNAIVLFNDQESDIDIDMNGTKEEEAILGILPTYSPPDPLERANLVQLKKMMELEKYRKYRLSYLRQHTNHLDKGSRLSQNFSSKISKQDLKNGAKKFKMSNIPADRINKSGMFSISLLDTVDDKDIEEPDVVKPLDNNTASKLKFTNNDNKPEFELPSKPRAFREEEKPTQSVVNTESPVKISKKVDANVSIDDQPSVAFKFGNSTSTATNTENMNKSKDSKGSTETKTESKPAFSFGNGSTPTVIKSGEESKPAINFGVGAQGKTPTLETVVDKDSDSATDPLLSKNTKKRSNSSNEDDGNAKPVFSFGTPATASKTTSLSSSDPISTGFSFSTKKSEEKKEESVAEDKSTSNGILGGVGSKLASASPALPKLNFGAGSSTSINPINKDSDQKEGLPKFSFGNPASAGSLFGAKSSSEEKPNDKVNSTATKTGFTVGSAPFLSTVFGNKPDSDAEPAKPSKPATGFTFGQNSTTPPTISSASKTPAFGLKSDDTAKPASSFSFNPPAPSSETKSETLKPGLASSFKFGATTAPSPASAAATQSDDSSKQTFDFGAKTAIPKMNFGTKTDNKTSGSSAPASTGFGLQPPVGKAATPGFSFGSSSSNQQTNEPESSNPPAKKVLTGFSFNKDASKPATSAATFGGFGSSSATPPLAAASKPATSGFSFGNSTANANPANIFGSKVAPISFGSENGSTNSAPAAPASNFSFGAGTSSVNPADIFGGNSNNGNNASSATNSNTGNKLFATNSNSFPSLGQTSNLGAAANGNGFNFGSTSTPPPATNTSAFGGFGSNNNGFANNNATPGFGGTTGNFNNGGNTASAFNFGSSNGSAPNSGANSRSSTPGFNFSASNNNGFNSGMNNANGQGMNNMNSMPPMNVSAGAQAAVMNRRKAYPRSMRNRR